MQLLRLLCAVAFLAGTATAADEGCEIYEGTLRLDDQTVSKINFDQICAITGNLLIFTNRYEELSFASLQEVQLINIDTDGLKSLALPSLSQARDIYIKAYDLETLELPYLESAKVFSLHAPKLQELNLPQLQRLHTLRLMDNVNLVNIDIPQLRDVYKITLEGNDSLSDEIRDRLKRAEVVMTDEERTAIDQSNKAFAETRRKGLTIREAPVHRSKAARFGTRGFHSKNYPRRWYRPRPLGPPYWGATYRWRRPYWPYYRY